jgi:hypothetical protein
VSVVEAVGAGLHNRRWHDFDIGDALLAYLLFFLVGVIENGDLTIDERHKKLMVEVTKTFFGKLCIPRDVRDEIFLIRRRRKIHN